ncbi:hypothetical protein M0804_013499 [Polistes exclamans]|nr:hypothetical protein M0804_013499 [Polistes exclamans]
MFEIKRCELSDFSEDTLLSSGSNTSNETTDPDSSEILSFIHTILTEKNGEECHKLNTLETKPFFTSSRAESVKALLLLDHLNLEEARSIGNLKLKTIRPTTKTVTIKLTLTIKNVLDKTAGKINDLTGSLCALTDTGEIGDVCSDTGTKSTKPQNSRKRKISVQKNNNNNFSTTLPAKWLHNIPISNSYDILDESTVTQNTTGKAVEEKKAVKPPLIYIDAEIIDPMLELLDETIGRNNYVIKQLKDNQVKVQTTTPDTFRKMINSLKTKNAGYHTYQEKNEKSY